MEAITGFLDWLESREGLLSAITALAAMVGVSYGVIAFIFPGINRRLRRLFGHEEGDKDAGATATVPARGQDDKAPDKPVGRASVAVLPLRALSSSEEDQNIAAGISSEIGADLAQLPDLRVTSHLATMQFQGRQVDLAEVAHTLSIRYVITGSFQRLGDRMRLMAELTDAVSGDQLWASTYDREVSDLFEVQAEVSRSIVGAIGGELKLADTRVAYEAPTDNLDAWGLVQKAFNFWLTRFTPDDYDKSLALLRKAVDLDPDYAAAHASLSMILSTRFVHGMSPDPDKDRRESNARIEEAVRLGPKDLTVLQNAGLVWTNNGKMKRARDVLRTAVELAPLDLMSWGYLAYNLGFTGEGEELDESLEILDRLLKMAPRHPSRPYWLYFKAGTLVRAGRLEEARQMAERAIDLQPAYYLAHLTLANIHGRLGNLDEAREYYQQVLAINPVMTTEFALEQYRSICNSEERAEAFVSGLRNAGLLSDRAPDPQPAPAT